MLTSEALEVLEVAEPCSALELVGKLARAAREGAESGAWARYTELELEAKRRARLVLERRSRSRRRGR